MTKRRFHPTLCTVEPRFLPGAFAALASPLLDKPPSSMALPTDPVATEKTPLPTSWFALPASNIPQTSPLRPEFLVS